MISDSATFHNYSRSREEGSFAVVPLGAFMESGAPLFPYGFKFTRPQAAKKFELAPSPSNNGKIPHGNKEIG
jgi:hypothetical protein